MRIFLLMLAFCLVPALAEASPKKRLPDFFHQSFEAVSAQPLADYPLGGADVAAARSDETGAIPEADVLWVRLRHRIDAALLHRARLLRMIATPTTGLTHIDVEDVERRGIELVCLRGETAFLNDVRATAEHTIGLILSLLRHIPASTAHVRRGGWDRGYRDADRRDWGHDNRYGGFDHRDADRRDWGRDHNDGSWNNGRDHNGWSQNRDYNGGWNHGGNNTASNGYPHQWNGGQNVNSGGNTQHSWNGGWTGGRNSNGAPSSGGQTGGQVGGQTGGQTAATGGQTGGQRNWGGGGWNRGGTQTTTTTTNGSTGVASNTGNRNWSGGQARTASYSRYSSPNTGATANTSGRSYSGVSGGRSGGSHR